MNSIDLIKTEIMSLYKNNPHIHVNISLGNPKINTKEDRRFRYLNAKHDVAEWVETHGLQGFMDLIDRVNDGEDFITVYSS